MASFRSNNADHKRIKAVMSRAFSERSLAAQESLLTDHVASFIKKLRERVRTSNTKPIDMAQWFNFVTFDIIGDLGFGESFHCVENGEYHEWVEGVIKYMKMRTILQAIGSFPVLTGLLLAMTPRSLKKKRTQMYRWSADRVEKRIATKTDRPDFYTPILSQSEEKALTDAELREAGLVLIIAGSETVSPGVRLLQSELNADLAQTASALAGIMYFLGRYPDVLSRLTTEIRTSYNEEREINVASLSDRTMLNAVLEESLRLFPAVSGIVVP